MAVKLCGWEGNCRSCVGLAIRHRLSGIATYGFSGIGIITGGPGWMLGLAMLVDFFLPVLELKAQFPLPESTSRVNGP